MKTLSKEECQTELKRIETIDGLEQDLEAAFDKMGEMSPSDLLTLAPKLLLGKSNPLTELGLDPKLLDKGKLVIKANRIIRNERKKQLQAQMSNVIEEAQADE
ncbi:hypothetical protein [Vibrio harveyi]|uniref:hypothetical protein n=1 Tax=Vibrio harveyi TaxID=669 RepID=UPI0023804F19|nr:hypothetical protein [Vibrio harveyi]